MMDKEGRAVGPEPLGADVLGFLQLCADRRYHRRTMDAFQRCAGLAPEHYWIEAAAGGAAAFETPTLTADFAYAQGARVMGWAAHGNQCGGFPGRSDSEIRAALMTVLSARAEDFPDAQHWFLFGHGGEIEVIPFRNER